MRPDDITVLKNQALREMDEAKDLGELEVLRITYLGSRGHIKAIMQALKNADSEDKRPLGQNANSFKTELAKKLQSRKRTLQQRHAPHEKPAFDVTLPGQWRNVGSRHPISLVTERIIQIFDRMGFTLAKGPDIETVFNNFDALNTPADHPTRSPQDTFFLDSGELLRTHTSPVQVRYMKEHSPPVRIIAPGRCYRRDTPDATHSANFHQVEGLYVDDQVSMADLKGDLLFFFRELIGDDVRIRFRPHFFPFTEPSVEVDIASEHCLSGKWIEICGAGMVDPEVFGAVGYDPESIGGYAFGMGVERIVMILYGINDIRQVYENDVRFLRQFTD